ncbi:class I SAM-dependent methyltransferase [Salipaludibacillus aurantiacus]|uniref:Methyltransferase domain-containing protein n=1 Tax=Salipaludibacillus aurantiacus TaxID=1601833 RepID=A0A1H9TUX7_9BACI|nr:class I SAM-dependent methyltransferase [Salipaludibacillus aurantiacus]SES00842.1 Methyltransferase domain-containing protein [Salipaludibacillus aurantiacus]
MSHWKAYEELAWTEFIISSLDDYEEEASAIIQSLDIKTGADTGSFKPDLLHFGCGAGGHDYYFKQAFDVTGVDISHGMLQNAQKINPEVTYLYGDMRSVTIGKSFDAVVFPESLMYMTTVDDIRQALQNAAAHLKPHGKILVTVHTKEEFQPHNFAYAGEKDGVHVTLFENNYIVSETAYEAAMVYLIRNKKGLEIHHDVHTVGLFPYGVWTGLFSKLNLDFKEWHMAHLYDRNILDEGDYPQTYFVCTKKE